MFQHVMKNYGVQNTKFLTLSLNTLSEPIHRFSKGLLSVLRLSIFISRLKALFSDIKTINSLIHSREVGQNRVQ